MRADLAIDVPVVAILGLGLDMFASVGATVVPAVATGLEPVVKAGYAVEELAGG